MEATENSPTEMSPTVIELINQYISKGMTATEIKRELKYNQPNVTYNYIQKMKILHNQHREKNSIPDVATVLETICPICEEVGFVDADCESCPYMHNIQAFVAKEEEEQEAVVDYSTNVALWEIGIKVLEDGSH